jgi:hypothetical protein
MRPGSSPQPAVVPASRPDPAPPLTAAPQPRPPASAQPQREPLPPSPVPPLVRTTGTSSIFGHKPFPFEDERAYVLAASLIALNDFPSSTPFRVEGTGLDEGTELFAVDHAGIRFYLSLLSNQDASVSKAGTLLLNRQEALRHRGCHERLINTLRMRGLILPAESGTVVRSREDLIQRVDFRLHALLEILLGLSSITAWHMQVSVLDSRIHQMLPVEAPPPRTGRLEPERGRGLAGPKRTDVRMLDRLLTREKKIAETILQSISAAADHHEVEYLIGLAGGTSDGWKVILRAVLQVSQTRYPGFVRAVVECQDANAIIEPLIVLAVGTESFSLSM